MDRKEYEPIFTVFDPRIHFDPIRTPTLPSESSTVQRIANVAASMGMARETSLMKALEHAHSVGKSAFLFNWRAASIENGKWLFGCGSYVCQDKETAIAEFLQDIAKNNLVLSDNFEVIEVPEDKVEEALKWKTLDQIKN